jgi:hypothetical protein
VAIGYVILNEDSEARSILGDGNPVYRDRIIAEKEACHLRQKYHSKNINVYELTDPGIVYSINEEDIYEIARQNRIGKKRVQQRMEKIQKEIEDGFYNWGEIVGYAINKTLT